MASPFHLQHLPWILFCGIPDFLRWVEIQELGIAEVTEPELGIAVVLSQGWISNRAGSCGNTLGNGRGAGARVPWIWEVFGAGAALGQEEIRVMRMRRMMRMRMRNGCCS